MEAVDFEPSVVGLLEQQRALIQKQIDLVEQQTLMLARIAGSLSIFNERIVGLLTSGQTEVDGPMAPALRVRVSYDNFPQVEPLAAIATPEEPSAPAVAPRKTRAGRQR